MGGWETECGSCDRETFPIVGVEVGTLNLPRPLPRVPTRGSVVDGSMGWAGGGD